ncbi:FCD domain-containing protein [Streptomyces sp. JV176]|uniref:FadR/GntR family transcriptional regulator n=1 Tax=Streptomyces sp. JV176 TaxID=858630 RepID=UPI002E7730FA|nr:FCD domain-containing protein [Streptomyces sp. JV176]MEE1803085.1 FCD domain-containing protein [Streptomyces sp. JV176]
MAPYTHRGVHGRTVETLARRVLGGGIPEGATLDLGALRRELDVSLTVLRESLKVLAAKGMVDARQKRGTFVRPRADWNLLDADVLRWQFADGPGAPAGPALLRDLGELRAIVGPAAARLAAERRTDADLTALETALGALAESAGSPARAAEAALAFHRGLLAATGNELLERMEMVVGPGPAHQGSPPPADPVPGHRAVLDAVRARDRDAAEQAMRALLGVRDLGGRGAAG